MTIEARERKVENPAEALKRFYPEGTPIISTRISLARTSPVAMPSFKVLETCKPLLQRKEVNQISATSNTSHSDRIPFQTQASGLHMGQIGEPEPATSS